MPKTIEPKSFGELQMAVKKRVEPLTTLNMDSIKCAN